MSEAKYAVVTVTDSNYLKGTEVLLYSFIKNNPWFKGDLVVIESDLTDSEEASLRKFPNLKFLDPSDALLRQIEILSNYWEVAKENPKQFFSIEAFRLTEYEKLLFLDSDMLCIGSVQELFLNESPAPVQAALDSLAHKEELRSQLDFLPCPVDKKEEGMIYYKSFNSGCLLLNFENLSEACYLDLVKLINPIFFRTNRTRHTDQFILNQYFREQVEFINDSYNYLLNVHAKINLKELRSNTSIKIIHYLEYTKPWKMKEADNSFGSLWKEYAMELSRRYNNEFGK